MFFGGTIIRTAMVGFSRKVTKWENLFMKD